MTPDAIKQLQTQLGLPATGVFDAATSTAMQSAVTKALWQNRDVQTYGGSNSPDAIFGAYTSGDWSGVTSLSGKPFTDEQQQAAVAEAKKALAPGFEASNEFDAANTRDTLAGDQAAYSEAEKTAATQFGKDKDTLDQNAADNGVLFSGARVQKNNDLRTSYADAEATRRRQAADNITGTARTYAYNYGAPAAKKLSDLYNLPGASTYNANAARGPVTKSPLSAVYSPSEYAYQGTQPAAQQAAVQTRAAGLLANRANKLSLSGYGTKL